MSPRGSNPDYTMALEVLEAVTVHLEGEAHVASMQAWIRDGDAILEAVEEAMETTFAPAVLQELIEQGKGFATPESAGGSVFQQARDEVRRLEAEESSFLQRRRSASWPGTERPRCTATSTGASGRGSGEQPQVAFSLPPAPARSRSRNGAPLRDTRPCPRSPARRPGDARPLAA